MEIYVVLMEGVYLQGVIGVFRNGKEALHALNTAIIGEPDDYHDFFIVKGKIGKLLNLDNEVYRDKNGKGELEPISQEFIDKLLAGK